jgi:hypothetical protein
VSGGGWDELEQRARESADSGGTPAEWGKKIDLEVGETFRGLHRGYEEGGKSGAYLAWDEDGEPRFIWSCASLQREYDRENPSVGDDVAIVRAENYRTRFDDDLDDPSGKSFGVAAGENRSPVPGAGTPPSDDDEAPF